MAEFGAGDSTPAIAEPFVDPTFDRTHGGDAVSRRALFLDRDGVINVNHGYVHRAEETQFVDGIFEMCHAASRRGYLLIVATNQAGIGRGYYSREDFLDYTAWVHAQFRDHGVPLSATYYCPHHPTEALSAYRVACECRKPRPGMLLAAERKFMIDMSRSVFIGDTVNDMLAGAKAGVGRLLLLGDHDPSAVRESPVGTLHLRELTGFTFDGPDGPSSL
jgi:D-glycero-D-manno-heptose 1,7-bisphosphate phosphatase